MKHHTADVECSDGSRASVTVPPASIGTWIMVAIAVLGMLATSIAYAVNASDKATSAHTRIDEIRSDVREIRGDIKSLTTTILDRLPDK